MRNLHVGIWKTAALKVNKNDKVCPISPSSYLNIIDSGTNLGPRRFYFKPKETNLAKFSPNPKFLALAQPEPNSPQDGMRNTTWGFKVHLHVRFKSPILH